MNLISVEDKLPKSGKYVLCYNQEDTSHYKNGYIVGYYNDSIDDEGKGWMYPNGFIATPTHWCELPKKPEKKSTQFDKPYMMLKFGDIKYADYSTSPKALEISNSFNWQTPIDEYKEKTCQVIDAFKGKIFSWYDNKRISKKAAKEYILSYVENNYGK